MAVEISKVISVEKLRKLLDCDLDTGTLTWRARGAEDFAGCKNPTRAARAWNAKHVGKPAFAKKLANGYLAGRVLGIPAVAHRVVWAMATGQWLQPWPAEQIDHINGNREDNRLENLRVVTASANCRNQRLRQNNRSGVMGVHWDRQHGKWVARIELAEGRKFLGRFTTKADAVAARKSAERQHNFHPNHGAR